MPQPNVIAYSAYAYDQSFALTFSQPIEGTHLAAPSAFQIYSASTIISVTSLLLDTSGTVLTGNLSAPFGPFGYFQIDYTDPSSGDDAFAIQSLDGADLATTSFGGFLSPQPLPQPPVAPSTPLLTPNTDSGVLDGITNNANLTVTGTAGPGNTVAIYDTNGITVLNTGTADANGDYSIVLPTLSEGGHTLTATQTDASNLISPSSTNSLVTIDLTSPTAPNPLQLAPGNDTGLSTTDGVTRNTTPSLTGTAEPGATVTLYDTSGATILGTAVADTIGIYAITTPTLAEGAHSLTTRATDVAGNIGPLSSTTHITIDTTPPTLAISTSTPQLHGSETATITFTFSEDPGNSFAWNGNTGDIVVAGGTLGAISGAGLTRTAIFTPTQGQNAGAASITVTPGSYTDAAGNSGSSGATPSLTFDTLAPTIQGVAADPASGAVGTGQTISFTLAASEALTVTGTPSLILTDGSTATYFSGSGTANLVFTITLSPGQNVAGFGIAGVSLPTGAAIRDAAGNNATLNGAVITFPSLTLDTIAPTVTAALASGAPGGITNSPFLTGSGEPGGIVTILYNNSALGQVPIDANGVWGFTPTLPDGNYAFEIEQADAAGNVGAANVAFRLDTTTPILTATLIPGDDPRRGTTTLAGTASPGALILIHNGETLLGTATADNAGAWHYSPTLPDGAYTLTASTTNAAGTLASLTTPLTMDMAGTTAGLPHPFLTLAVSNNDPAAIITLTASIKPASLGQFYDLGHGHPTTDGNGVIITGTAADITADLQHIVFVPAPGQPTPSSAIGVLTGEAPGATLQGSAGNVLVGDPVLSRTLVGGTKGSAFITQGGPTFIQGGSGHDTISAVSGNVTIVSGAGGSLIGLGTGTALVNSRGPDTIIGGAGSATIGAATGSLVGLGSGMALVSAAAGATVVGGGGANTVGVRGEGILMFGGAGNTTFIGGTGSSTVIGGSGSATLFGGQGGGLLGGGAAGNNIMVAGQQSTTLVGGGGNDVLFAQGSGGAMLVAGSGNTTLQGGASTGTDIFFAGAGNTLIGLGVGSGKVFAGSSASTVVGGAGATTYAVLNGHAGGTEQIIGFKLGIDQLALGGFNDGEISRALASVKSNAGNATTAASATLTLSDNTRITFMDVTKVDARIFG